MHNPVMLQRDVRKFAKSIIRHAEDMVDSDTVGEFDHYLIEMEFQIRQLKMYRSRLDERSGALSKIVPER